MEIVRAGSRLSGKGPAAQFTGTVRRDTLFTAEPPGRVQSGVSTFERGALDGTAVDWLEHVDDEQYKM